MVGTTTGGQTAYASTKAAVHGFTVALALEVARYGINVNCVYPGFIHTSSAYRPKEDVSNEYAEETMRKFGLSLPMGRQGTPQDVSKAVLFLASDESSYITGTGIVVDGGTFRACTHPND
jgi:hypothetical protein